MCVGVVVCAGDIFHLLFCFGFDLSPLFGFRRCSFLSPEFVRVVVFSCAAFLSETRIYILVVGSMFVRMLVCWLLASFDILAMSCC